MKHIFCYVLKRQKKNGFATKIPALLKMYYCVIKFCSYYYNIKSPR